LGAAIQRHAEASAWRDHVAEAQRRLDDDYFDRRQPAVAAAEKALVEAQERAPEALVALALGEAVPDAPSVAEAEAALAEAERKLVECRAARTLLDEEAPRAQVSVDQGRFAVDVAVAAAVAADPARAALREEFVRAARRALRCAMSLRSSGLVMGGAEAHGLRFIITDAAAPVGARAFWPDAGWIVALAALRDDADAPLPGLPSDDPDAGDGDSCAAAA
jgi:hypothetical protein